MEAVIYQVLQLFVFNIKTRIFLQFMCLAVANIVETQELNHRNYYEELGQTALIEGLPWIPNKETSVWSCCSCIYSLGDFKLLLVSYVNIKEVIVLSGWL